MIRNKTKRSKNAHFLASNDVCVVKVMNECVEFCGSDAQETTFPYDDCEQHSNHFYHSYLNIYLYYMMCLDTYMYERIMYRVIRNKTKRSKNAHFGI